MNIQTIFKEQFLSANKNLILNFEVKRMDGDKQRLFCRHIGYWNCNKLKPEVKSNFMVIGINVFLSDKLDVLKYNILKVQFTEFKTGAIFLTVTLFICR